MSDPLHESPWNAAHQASLSLTISQSLSKVMSIELVMPSNHLILSHPLFLLPSVFPSISVFSNESAVLIRWPKYWGSNFYRLHMWVFYIYIYHSFIQQISDYLFYCWQDARCHLTVTKLVYFFPWSPTSIFSTREQRLSDLIPQLKTKGQNPGFSVSLGILIVPLKCQDLIVHIIAS